MNYTGTFVTLYRTAKVELAAKYKFKIKTWITFRKFVWTYNLMCVLLLGIGLRFRFNLWVIALWPIDLLQNVKSEQCCELFLPLLRPLCTMLDSYFFYARFYSRNF